MEGAGSEEGAVAGSVENSGCQRQPEDAGSIGAGSMGAELSVGAGLVGACGVYESVGAAGASIGAATGAGAGAGAGADPAKLRPKIRSFDPLVCIHQSYPRMQRTSNSLRSDRHQAEQAAQTGLPANRRLPPRIPRNFGSNELIS